ncbi:hypothetical protein ACFQRC_08395 [Enterovirga sp. GCM10030262]|uniref:hypothetical protein n=1 Tax=Enterovirga sp. GCM10030262 TaxID=3273391 RepID=UPI00360C6A97
MKLSTTLATGAAFLLASCGPKTLALPAEPVDRAATCGVVAAAEARAATPDITQPLPFTAQGRILHYALLAGAAGEEFSAEAATRVNARMSELQEEITGGKWEELGPACRAAFPVVENEDVTLPEDRFDAQLGCDEIGDFMSAALRSQEADYGAQLSEYRAVARNLDQTLGPGLRSRAGAGLEAQQQARRVALSEFAKLGSPVAIMRQCVERYG